MVKESIATRMEMYMKEHLKMTRNKGKALDIFGVQGDTN